MRKTSAQAMSPVEFLCAAVPSLTGRHQC